MTEETTPEAETVWDVHRARLDATRTTRDNALAEREQRVILGQTLADIGATLGLIAEALRVIAFTPAGIVGFDDELEGDEPDGETLPTLEPTWPQPLGAIVAQLGVGDVAHLVPVPDEPAQAVALRVTGRGVSEDAEWIEYALATAKKKGDGVKWSDPVRVWLDGFDADEPPLVSSVEHEAVAS